MRPQSSYLAIYTYSDEEDMIFVFEWISIYFFIYYSVFSKKPVFKETIRHYPYMECFGTYAMLLSCSLRLVDDRINLAVQYIHGYIVYNLIVMVD